MASSKDRQRALARLKLERQMARRAAEARRKRQIYAGVGAVLALALVVLGGWWVKSEFFTTKKGDKPSTALTAGPCKYEAMPEEEKQQLKDKAVDVGMPDGNTVARSGTATMTMQIPQGKVEIQLDLEKAPCNSASISYLASKDYYDNSYCARLFEGGIQCGSKSLDLTGGPTYRVNNENLPINKRPGYPKGTVAMANSGPDTGAAQFFILTKDTDFGAAQGAQGGGNAYTIVGRVTSGLDVLEKIADKGHDKAFDPTEANQNAPGGGHPKEEVKIADITVTGPVPNQANPSASPSPSPGATPTTSPTGSPTASST